MGKPTVLINAMGTYRPTTREIDGDIVEHAILYADYLPSCLVEAGEYLIPAASGHLDLTWVLPLSMARTLGSQEGITVMKSVGSAIFDLAGAEYLSGERKDRTSVIQ
jgi:ornithine cyclodeaminase/alanine dehydrogenase-like protein (mu-crystallin family)